MYELASVAIETWIAVYRRAPLLTIILTILGLVGVATGVYYTNKAQREKLEAQRLENYNYTKQLESLNQVRENLQGFLEFVDAERENIKKTEDALVRMKDEHQKLKPLVEADRSIIDALFTAQEARNQTSQTRERWIGFGLGVLASLIASFVYAISTYLVRRGKAAKSV